MPSCVFSESIASIEADSRDYPPSGKFLRLRLYFASVEILTSDHDRESTALSHTRASAAPPEKTGVIQ